MSWGAPIMMVQMWRFLKNASNQGKEKKHGIHKYTTYMSNENTGMKRERTASKTRTRSRVLWFSAVVWTYQIVPIANPSVVELRLRALCVAFDEKARNPRQMIIAFYMIMGLSLMPDMLVHAMQCMHPSPHHDPRSCLRVCGQCCRV